jgi:hypothetical protein
VTQSEFLEDLQKYAPLVQWNLYRGGQLRTLNGKHCPISFVTWKKLDSKYGHKEVLAASDLLNLEFEDVEEIVLAADKAFMNPSRKALRAKLIEITKPLQTVDA